MTVDDLARLALVAAMCALLGLIGRAGIERYKRHAGTEPWWGALPMAGFVVVAVIDQLERIDEPGLTWRWWALAVSSAVGFVALRVVVRTPR